MYPHLLEGLVIFWILNWHLLRAVSFFSPLYFFNSESWTLIFVLVYLYFYFVDLLLIKAPRYGGYSCTLMKKLIIWKWFNQYFPIDLKRTVLLDKNLNYMFCCHPTGLYSFGVIGNFISGYSNANQLFPRFNIKVAIPDKLFYLPIYRHVLLFHGAISNKKSDLKNLLNKNRKGNIIALNVGGREELASTTPHEYLLNMKKLEGYIKLAIETGCYLVPVFSFGENETFDKIHLLRRDSMLYKFQNSIIKITGIPLRFPPSIEYIREFMINFYNVFSPKQTPITTIVGDPIPVPHLPNPTPDVVNRCCDNYMKAVRRLFAKHKIMYLDYQSYIYIHRS